MSTWATLSKLSVPKNKEKKKEGKGRYREKWSHRSFDQYRVTGKLCALMYIGNTDSQKQSKKSFVL